MYDYRCAVCGCSLDPGEGRICEDCIRRDHVRDVQEEKYRKIIYEGGKGQYTMNIPPGGS